MSIELKIPDVGESIREVQIGRWLKKEGDTIRQDENVVELETDKASMELPAPEAGVLAKVIKREGETVKVGEVIGYLEPSNGAAVAEEISPPQSSKIATDKKPTPNAGNEVVVTPAARRALRDYGLTAADIPTDGPRLHRKDVLRYVEEQKSPPPASEVPATKSANAANEKAAEPAEGGLEQFSKSHDQQPRPNGSPAYTHGDDNSKNPLEEIVPLSLIRRRIAERLVQAQQQAALLTTFNEIDMSAVKALRAAYREPFQQKYGVKLGFMSFFVKALVDALKQQPVLNAEIRGDKIVYRNYYHIGVAIGSTKGLVVPVLRFAERLSFAEIERTIDDFAQRAAQNKLQPNELAGGTFTITNGGVYGSLLSTPIVNPPQSGVLGMHAIQDRPVAREGEVVIRPMMYVALTYDHRLVDGREAVSFLTRIRAAIEDPSRMLLEV